jgi:hypothetical protein
VPGLGFAGNNLIHGPNPLHLLILLDSPDRQPCLDACQVDGIDQYRGDLLLFSLGASQITIQPIEGLFDEVVPGYKMPAVKKGKALVFFGRP